MPTTSLIDLTDARDDDITSMLTHAHRTITRSKAALIAAIAQFHARGLAEHFGAPSTATWLIRHFQLASSTARELVRVAVFITQHPRVADAFYLGRLSYCAVRLLMAVVDESTTEDEEDAIVAAAEGLTITELRAALAPLRTPREDKVEKIRIRTQDDGWTTVSITLNPDTAAEFAAALKTAELSNYGDTTTKIEDSDVQPGDVADQIAGLDPHGTHGAGVVGVSRFGAPARVRLMGAFKAVVHIVRSQPVSRVRAPGAEVIYVVREDDGGVPRVVSDPSAVATGRADKLFNARMRTLLVDGVGNAVSLSSSTRLATNRQVKALVAQWSGVCATPGCGHSRWLEMHHIVDWAQGGPTDMWNLVVLCSACHTLVTNGQMRITIDDKDPSRLHFRARGSHFVSCRRGAPVTLESLLARKAPTAA
ncbi:HNH endonuclease signature motif containing protein [Corynebacterium uterequi]|uniref:HNH nuclease domain-containing protein n=1 Tax=Corynebacterium uterequi TaxID=1072256 RepID=A0A0G3HAM9_9CORY|nr:HNH endonuclease signature motif containing protein [Corynebacterium uterequi]AKK10411.1 protein of unknown function DUF222/HNH endonuclease [Corynebacterium uterequi]